MLYYFPLKSAQNRRSNQGNSNSNVYIAVEKPDLRGENLLIWGGVRGIDR
jgi:hypothetical protein